ncbi:MAG: amino acid permease [Sandaracinaceae bacterium]|nr:amino acid permease [Sandaracinaceae bacterium]
MASAVALIVGSMIGSGIFIAPAIMAGWVASPVLLVGLWAFGGLLTLLGALSYAELAALFPEAGGQYLFLREAFGSRTAFLYGWTLFLVIQTGFHAAVSIAFAKHLALLGLPVGEEHVLLSIGKWRLPAASLLACGVIIFLTWINVLGVREGAFVQNTFTLMKVLAVFFLALSCLVVGEPFQALRLGTPLGPNATHVGILGAMGAAMSKALFAYDAWNTVTFVAGEVREPERNLPRSLAWGTVLTTFAYLAVTFGYLAVIPIEEMPHLSEHRVGAEAAYRIWGELGRLGVTIAILVSTFGCVNGLILGGARVFYAMAKDGLFFSYAKRIHPRFGTPSGGLWIQAIWSCVLAITGTYDALLTYVTFASLAFNALTVLALFELRRQRPDLKRPYRVWAYPWLPLAYVLGALFVLIYIFVGTPAESLAGLVVVGMGWVAYPFFAQNNHAHQGSKPPLA